MKNGLAEMCNFVIVCCHSKTSRLLTSLKSLPMFLWSPFFGCRHGCLLMFIFSYGFVTFSNVDSVNAVLTAGSIFLRNRRIAVATAIRKKHPDED